MIESRFMLLNTQSTGFSRRAVGVVPFAFLVESNFMEFARRDLYSSVCKWAVTGEPGLHAGIICEPHGLAFFYQQAGGLKTAIGY